MLICFLFLYLLRIKTFINTIKNKKNNNFGISKLLNKKHISSYEGYDKNILFMRKEKLTNEMKEQLLINYKKKELLDYLERNDVSQLSKLYHIKESKYYLQENITSKYIPNIYSGTLQKEFEDFI
jgi:hypothetical protein